MNGERLLNEFIRPYVYALVDVCANESDYLAHEWEVGLEKSWKTQAHYDGNLFAYAYIYLSGFYNRHDKGRLAEEEIVNEYKQLFYLFEMALQEFGFFKDKILMILEEATLKAKNQFKISSFHSRCKRLMKKYNYEEPSETRKQLLNKVSKEEIIEDVITRKIKEDGSKILSPNEVKKLTKRRVDKISEYAKTTEAGSDETPNRPPKVKDEYTKETIGQRTYEQKPEGREEPPHKRARKKLFTKKVIIGVTVTAIIILLIVVLIYMANLTVSQEVTEQVTKTAKATEMVDEIISFSEYIDDPESYNGVPITLNGFLKKYLKGTQDIGVITQCVVDDNGDIIDIINPYNKFKEYFPNEGVSEDLYSVSGTFKLNYKELGIEITHIEKTERSKVAEDKPTRYSETVVRTLNKPKYPKLRNVIFPLIGKEITCEDGTSLDVCSTNQPYYCTKEGLIKKPVECGCPDWQRLYDDQCIERIECSDGTLHPDCSESKKMQCFNGEFVMNAVVCGCPDGYANRGTECIKTCNDGTLSGECSENKPFFCSNGRLLEKASTCGCPVDYKPKGDTCVSRFLENPTKVDLDYVLRGDHGTISYTLYGALNGYLSDISRSYFCCPTDKEIELTFLDNEHQKAQLIPLVDKIREITPIQDDQVRIAINLVQQIPYDDEGVRYGSLNNRYPYEVLYDRKGVCGEKSKLLAFILRELGYGVAVINYKTEEHEAVGIKCPEEYDYFNSGYCFIETTQPSIITYYSGDYALTGKLGEPSSIIEINDGYSFDSVDEEYEDAIRYDQIVSMGQVLSEYYYNEWYRISTKYGMPTTD